MPPKRPSAAAKPNESNAKRIKSILVVPSRVGNRPDEKEGVEETEIAAQISVPPEGGWGWVVVTTAFLCIFILDGVAFTFGAVFRDITQDLEIEESVVAIINSIAIAMYYAFGPVTSALINRFGFRAVTMSGAVIVAISLFCSYFSTSLVALCIFYGFTAGCGYCMINMSSSLVVGFYFEKLRALVISIAANGSSLGVMIMFPLNTYLVKIAGWRTLTLLQSGTFGIVYFLGMAYRPIISLTVTTTLDESTDPTRTVTYLPNLSKAVVGPAPSRMKAGVSEKLFSAVSNRNFPTAAAVVEEAKTGPSNQPGPSTAGVTSRLTLTAHSPRGGMSRRQIKQVQSIMSRTSVPQSDRRSIEITAVNIQPAKKKRCWQRLCQWDEHIPQSRPMYRDDAFYEGNVQKLPIYQKSMMDTSPETKTGLEYQLAVSRAVTTADLQEKRGVCTTAARRILATMMDPKLLKRKSFLMMGISGCFTYLGFLVPYVYIKERSQHVGIDESHSIWFVSVIGFTNAVGRMILGMIAIKVKPLFLFMLSCFVSGIVTLLSNLSFNVYYQYVYCCIFGFFIASIPSLRSLVLVELYGLEKLTNATGMMLFFQGFGCLLSTPGASLIKGFLGFSAMFYASGFFITIGGVCLLPIKSLSNKENAREAQMEDAEQNPIIGPKNRE